MTATSAAAATSAATNTAATAATAGTVPDTGPGPATGAAPASPLAKMTATQPTALWNDSADPRELSQAISWGAVGATCNPVIALSCIKADQARWQARLAELAAAHPRAGESELGWKVVEELSADAAQLLEPAFERYQGINGRLSLQTDPRLHRDAQALADQAEHFSALAPNVIVKIPATAVGLEAIEEATYRGVSVNVTVSFTAAQAVAAGQAIERGLKRRQAEGEDTSKMGPVVTIMVGRLDDWMREVVKRERIAIDPGYLEWAGVAAFKRAYQAFNELGLRARLLSAAYRNILHLTEFVGGDVVVSPPFSWQVMINDNNLELGARMDSPVEHNILAGLLERVPEFRRAYEPDGLKPAEFDTFGATRKTLRQFLAANSELDALVREVLIPAP